jgi:hypothetical protein
MGFSARLRRAGLGMKVKPWPEPPEVAAHWSKRKLPLRWEADKKTGG